jgi:hypothetical protein
VSLVPHLKTAIFPGGRAGWVICAWAAMQSIAAMPDNMDVFFIFLFFYFLDVGFWNHLPQIEVQLKRNKVTNKWLAGYIPATSRHRNSCDAIVTIPPPNCDKAHASSFPDGLKKSAPEL